MTGLRSGNNEPGSIVRDNTAIIDLRRPPTRAELGFRPGRNDRSYQRAGGKPAIVTRIELPTGTLSTPAFVITASGDDNTPAGTANPRPPERIVVERLFPDVAAATSSLADDAVTLGLSRTAITSLMSRIAAGAGQGGVLPGLVQDWLAVSVAVIGQDDRTVQVNYSFTVNEFHNAAIDDVVRAGVFDIDLTTRPSRADLAFRDTFSLASVEPAPGQRLVARITLPRGVLQREVHSVRSSTTAPGVLDPLGTGEPRQTTVTLPSSSVASAERTLREDAAPLGLSLTDIEAAFGGERGTHVRMTLPGGSTPVCEITAIIDATPGQPGDFAASVGYRFTYRGIT
jgi:hypothetical protein